MPNDVSEIAMDYELPRGTAQVGAGLRAVREQLGWKLPDVAEALRIRLPYLEAIERGELVSLPGSAYQTGFVRSYAQILGLDPDEILRRFRAEGGIGTSAKAELSFLAPVPDRAVPTGAIVLVGVVLLLFGYGLWYHHTETERRLAQSVPDVPAELAPLAVPPKPAAVPAPKPAPVMAAQTAVAPTVATPAPPPAPTPVLAPAQPPASSPASAIQANAAPAATAPAPATPVAVTPGAAVPGAGQAIVATADDWVEVRDSTGNILFSKVLHAGESWPVPDESGLTMTAGNAGGTEIADNGKAGAPLGATGAVLHHYALTPAAPQSPAPAGSK
jgi:cytoskeleton protein RodZ